MLKGTIWTICKIFNFKEIMLKYLDKKLKSQKVFSVKISSDLVRNWRIGNQHSILPDHFVPVSNESAEGLSTIYALWIPFTNKK